MHTVGENGIAQPQGGLYFKKFFRIPVDTLLAAQINDKLSFIDKPEAVDSFQVAPQCSQAPDPKLPLHPLCRTYH